MQFQLKVFSIAALLALSVLPSTAVSDALNRNAVPSAKQNYVDALEEAVDKYATSSAIPACDPFIDPGCNVPTSPPKGPPGCSDCVPSSSEWAEILTKENKLVRPRDMEIQGKKYNLYKRSEDLNSRLFMSPKIGF